MRQVFILTCVAMLMAVSCRSTESSQSEFSLTEDNARMEAFETGPLPFIVHPQAHRSSQVSADTYRFMIPIGLRDEKSEQGRFFDRMLIRVNQNQTPTAIAVLSYPGFFQGELPPEPDVMVEIYQFDLEETTPRKSTFESAEASRQALSKAFGPDLKLSATGFDVGSPEKSLALKDGLEAIRFTSALETRFDIQAIDPIVFDAKHALPEQLGLMSDEYGILEKMVSLPIAGEASKTIYSGLQMRQLTVKQLLKQLQNQDRRTKIADTYKDEFSATAPEITEFDSTMDNEIKNEMMQLLRALNEE